MKVITLIENIVYQKGLTAEHGLSLYIEDGNTKILFDTGQTSAFIKNAEKLNISLKDIDYVVLSHGHYDHTGGLADFLKINTKASVVIKEQAFYNKMSDKTGSLQYIGIPLKSEEIRHKIICPSKTLQLSPHIRVEPNIPLYNQNDTHFTYMKIQNNNEIKEDTFEDELFLAVQKEKSISVISGCSHRGISNIVLTALAKYPLCSLGTVIGGFHLKEYNQKQNQFLINFFKENQAENIGVCHCTGVQSYADFKHAFHEKVFYNYTGLETLI